MEVLWPPSSKSPNFPAMQKYLMSNPTVTGGTFSVSWSEVDKGPGANPQYVWTSVDSRLAPWITAGKKVNLVVWPVSYGTNVATPTYVMNSLGSSNTVSCHGEVIPNYFSSAYLGPYEAFLAKLLAHYAGNTSVGYIRIGAGQGGEIYPVNGMETDSTCYNTFLGWGFTDEKWAHYVETLTDYATGLKPGHQLMLGITFIDGESAENEVVAHAVASGVGFGSQGFQLSDVTNYAEGKDCQGNWCDLFNQYQGQVPLQLQTKGQSQPSNAKPTGSLVNLLPFAAGLHANVFEIYWEDWLIAFAPGYPGYSQYHAAYASAIQAASQGN
jgi:hypothetical protein